MAETPPQTILAGRYVLHDELGRGGMASVWRATDEVLDRPVAVKILHEHLAENPSFRERFSTEALASAQLTHPNIVNVFDTGSENGLSFIVMELCEGSTLADVLRREGALAPDRAISILLPVLAALQCAHENGVVHRDVKPGNILVGDTGMVKVSDLGIARAAYSSSDATTTGRVLGSVPYLSPEQVQGSDVDARSDVYASGVVLYEMLTGRQPFAAETDLAAAMMRLTRDPLPPRAIRPGIPRALETVVQRAMARRPDDRFQSAENMAAALVRLSGPRQSAPLIPLPVQRERTVEWEREPSARRPGRVGSWMIVPLLAVILAVVAIVVGLALGKLEVGGPLGIKAGNSNPGPGRTTTGSVAPYRFTAVTAFDPPPGDGQEHDDEVGFVTDGRPDTYWETENYNELDLAPKPGVGLLFDLGDPRTVASFRLISPFPGFQFQIRVGNDPASLATTAGPSFTARSDMTEEIPQASGRYVLVWITSVMPDVDGGNRATIGEFRAFGPSG